MGEESSYTGHAFFSYGFRPFFFCAALFAGVAVPLWAVVLTGIESVTFHYPPREWHVHEMVFGFLPCVLTGFVLTALPNWTEAPPIQGRPLMQLVALWITGRWLIAIPWFPLFIVAIVDGVFLVVVAGLVFREIVTERVWDRLPIGALISLFAFANIFFHVLYLTERATGLAERMGLAIIMVLLALIGGRVTPSFTEDFMVEKKLASRPASFSLFDGLAILSIAIAAISWIFRPESHLTGSLFFVAGVLNVIRLIRWKGWLTWQEPLVLILHAGYGWLGMALLLLGGSILGSGLRVEDATHALTTGAVGVMTLAIMTRASLGHTGRVKRAGLLTFSLYVLVNLGAALRVFGPSIDLSFDGTHVLAAVCWSGAYVVFAIGYGHILFGKSLENS